MRMREPKAFGRDLRRFMKRRRMTEVDLARNVSAKSGDTAITQSWVSRIAHGQFKRPTDRIRTVASYVGIPIFEKSLVSPAGEKIIQEAVKSSWNGSLVHATIIARLIRAVRNVDGTDC